MCGYNMSTPTPLSNLSPPEASEFELFLLNRTQGHIIIYIYNIVRITGFGVFDEHGVYKVVATHCVTTGSLF